MNTERARQLRREMTEAEQFLWKRLRYRQLLGQRFRRQVPLGSFIVDFCCLERRLVVEVDGGQHVDEEAYDAARTRWLKEQGYRVLRFWNHEVFKEIEVVLNAIVEALEEEPRIPERTRASRLARGTGEARKEEPSPKPRAPGLGSRGFGGGSEERGGRE